MIFCLNMANIGDKSEEIYSALYNYVLILHIWPNQPRMRYYKSLELENEDDS